MDDNPGRDRIDEAEALIMKVRDIQSCRITTDEQGRITEIHVVAATDRQPKMIARDVETCLKAQLGIDVDYRKIGVVLIDAADDTAEEEQDPEARFTTAGLEDELDEMVEHRISETQQEMRAVEINPSGDETGRLEFLEDDNRARFRGLSIDIDEASISVDVRLEKSGVESVGHLEAFRKSGPIFETIAGATILALTELLDEDFHLCLSGIEKVELAGREALVAAVDIVDGRAVKSFAGSAFVGRDPNEAAVLSVLDAVNRPFGRWRSRREIHYRIK